MPSLIATLSMMQTLLLSALSVAREREQGTFDQLLVTPYTPTQIMIGKAIPPIIIGVIQSSIILAIILFWFQIPMNGSLTLLYFGLFAFNIAVVGVGLSISAIALNMQQAMLYVDFSDCTEYATSHAVYFLFDHAFDTFIWFTNSCTKYARSVELADLCQPATLWHRLGTTGVFGRCEFCASEMGLCTDVDISHNYLAFGCVVISKSFVIIE